MNHREVMPSDDPVDDLSSVQRRASVNVPGPVERAEGSTSDVTSVPTSTLPGLLTKYGTIVADPPWHYDRLVKGGPKEGSDVHHGPFPYPTMTVAEIAALPVQNLADDNCVLWLWVTNHYLPDAFGIVEAWGFTYKQTLVWGKNTPMPTGSLAPSGAEFLIAAKRGKPKTRWTWPNSVLMTARVTPRRHSAKPECFLDYIEASSPSPRLELFARRQRFGWDTWGNESLEMVEL
jgi:N6-adenosine-specific RNA methylase IME4